MHLQTNAMVGTGTPPHYYGYNRNGEIFGSLPCTTGALHA
jgi:hypothetical protein